MTPEQNQAVTAAIETSVATYYNAIATLVEEQTTAASNQAARHAQEVADLKASQSTERSAHATTVATDVLVGVTNALASV